MPFLKKQHGLFYSKAQVAVFFIYPLPLPPRPDNDLSSPPLHCEGELHFVIAIPLSITKPL